MRSGGGVVLNAYEEVLGVLLSGEKVEAMVFGSWGCGGAPDNEDDDDDDEYGSEPTPKPVPRECQNIILSFEEARPMMQTWKFRGGFGSPKCYACYIWTNKRVLSVHEYDGATSLYSVPRNPEITDTWPQMA